MGKHYNAQYLNVKTNKQIDISERFSLALTKFNFTNGLIGFKKLLILKFLLILILTGKIQLILF